VIVRIMGEGQFRVDDNVVERLNALDDRATAAIDRGDETDLDAALDEMAALVRNEGEAVPDDEITTSDVLIPPSDLTLDETRALFSDEGLIPDLPT
jgi:hypothetical protein